MSKSEIVAEMNALIAEHAEAIKAICQSYNLDMKFVTVIAHNPDKPELYTIVSEESDAQLIETAKLLARSSHAFIVNK